ncbi:MAG: GNAT family N-acetyltransferase [bacterium]|nr:GNAT family N-acetyltransferase [bacterium]
MKFRISEITAEETWPIRHKVMWPDMPFDFVKVENDHEGLHLGLFLDDKLSSIISVFKIGSSWQFRKFATLEEEQGKGLGSQLLKYVIDQAKLNDAELLWCNARKDKIGLYQKFKMMETDKTYVKGGIEFVVMELEL